MSTDFVQVVREPEPERVAVYPTEQTQAAFSHLIPENDGIRFDVQDEGNVTSVSKAPISKYSRV